MTGRTKERFAWIAIVFFACAIVGAWSYSPKAQPLAGRKMLSLMQSDSFGLMALVQNSLKNCPEADWLPCIEDQIRQARRAGRLSQYVDGGYVLNPDRSAWTGTLVPKTPDSDPCVDLVYCGHSVNIPGLGISWVGFNECGDIRIVYEANLPGWVTAKRTR